MGRTLESIEGKKVWFKALTGRLETGIVETVSDVTGLVWVKTDNGTQITSLKNIEAAGKAHKGLSSRRQMKKVA